MITLIRKSFKSKAYKIVLWITILAMAGIFSLPQLLKRTMGEPWIAKVNGQPILYNDFARKVMAVQEFINNVRAQYGTQGEVLLQTMGMSLDPKQAARNELIQDALLNQAACDLGVHIGTDYIAEKLKNPLFVQQELSGLVPAAALDRYGSINMPILKKYLNRMGLSYSDFESKVYEAMERTFLAQMIKQAVYLPGFVVKEYFITQFLPKKFTLLTIPIDSAVAVAQKAEVNETVLKSFFDAQNAQSQRYSIPEKRGGTVWSFDAKNYGIEVSDAEIENHYNQIKTKNYIQEPSKIHIRHIEFKTLTEADRPATLERAKKIQAQLLTNKDSFADIAAKVSDDKKTASRGGELEPFARGTYKDKNVEKAAFILKADGDISDIIATPQGFEIIQRISKSEPTFKSLAQVKKEVTTALIEQKFKDTFNKDIAEVVSKNAEKDLEAALQEKRGVMSHIAAIDSRNEQWGSSLFGLRSVGEVAPFMDKGVGYVIRLDSIASRHVPVLADVEKKVTEDFFREKAVTSLKELVKKIQATPQDFSVKELEKMYRVKSEQTAMLSAQDTSELKNLKEKNMPIQEMFQIEKPGQISAVFAGNNAFVIHLDEIAPYSDKEFDTKKAEVIKELETQEVRLFLAGFVASLFRSAKLESNESPAPLTEDYGQYEE